jgi:hypothetical protein
LEWHSRYGPDCLVAHFLPVDRVMECLWRREEVRVALELLHWHLGYRGILADLVRYPE